jgi:hypothetical protein
MQNHPDKSHFFASSVCTWITTNEKRDLRQLIKHMDKEGYPYNLFFVPVPHDADYEIKVYQPQVEGTQWAGFFEPKAKR